MTVGVNLNDVDLGAIWAQADSLLSWRDFQALLRAGIPASALIDHHSRGNSVGIAEIGIANGKWSPRFNGEEAFIVPVGDGDEIVDLVAFKLRSPRTFWPMTGAGMALGYEAIEEAEAQTHYLRNDGCPEDWLGSEWSAGALTVHESPFEWLRADRKGVVILSWQHYWPLYLGGIGGILASNRDFAMRLLEKLERPFSIPDVRFPA